MQFQVTTIKFNPTPTLTSDVDEPADFNDSQLQELIDETKQKVWTADDKQSLKEIIETAVGVTIKSITSKTV